MVARNHLPVLLAMEEVKVAWITDADSARARFVAHAFGVPFLKMPVPLSDLPLSDVVLLAIPFGGRDPFYQIFRDRGSAVYVEKPFARTAKQHREICSWFPPHCLACGLQRRSFGPTQLVRQLIENQTFGELQWLRFGFGRCGRIRSGSHQSALKQAGGGLLFEVGIHGVDSLLFLTRATRARVGAVHMVVDDGFDIHTDAEIFIDTPWKRDLGAKILVTCLEDTDEGVECGFEDASVFLPLFNGLDVSVRPVRGTDQYWITWPAQHHPTPSTQSQTLFQHWSTFLGGIRDCKPNRTSAVDTALTTEIIEELYLAGSSHQLCE